MNLASKSLFGENVNDGFTFENYARYLSSNGKSIDFMVTRISFNEDNDNQSVLFTATRHINRAEHAVITDTANDDTVKALVLMTPAKADGVTKQPPALPPAEVDTPEPTKRPSKKADVEPTSKRNLADVVSAWSKEE